MPKHIISVYKPVNSFDKLSDPNGIWEIKTEGDVEGRSTQLIGIFEGNIIDILTAIHEKCYYNFFIKKIEKTEEIFNSIKGPSKIKVFVDYPLDISSDEKKTLNTSLFKKDNIFIDENNGYDVILYFNEEAKTQETKERKKKIEKALSKLTKEEKELLGIV